MQDMQSRAQHIVGAIGVFTVTTIICQGHFGRRGKNGFLTDPCLLPTDLGLQWDCTLLTQPEEGAVCTLPGLFLCCRHVTYCGVMCFPLMVQDVTQRGMLGK